MNGLSVIIPSRTYGNLLACSSAVRLNDPDVNIILVDDGIGIENFSAPVDVVVQGDKPFIFARNCNLGIAAAGADDVILLNDDALLEDEEGFTRMQDLAYEHPEYGLISAACNNVGNLNQVRKSEERLRDEPRMVCFIAVLIPRTTIEKVGLLDEEFTGYGYDDDSYCLRVRQAGLKIGIFDGCFVDHKSLPSTYRAMNYPSEGFEHNRLVFERKYGASNHEL